MTARSGIPLTFLAVFVIGITGVLWFAHVDSGGGVEPPASTTSVHEHPEPADLSAGSTELARRIEPASVPVEAPQSNTGASEVPRCTVVGRCVDAGSRAIDGARVELAGYRPKPGVWRKSEPGVIALSGTDGRFELRFAPEAVDDAAVAVVLSLKAAGFVRTRADVSPTADGRFDAGDVRLELGVALTGTVRDAAGVPQAQVTIHAERRTDDEHVVSESGRGRDDGTFELVDVPGGMIRVWAEADDRRRGEDVGLDLVPGARRDGIELVLPLYEDSLAVSGVVVDLAGKPVPGAHISIQSKGERRSSISERDTDELGRFRARGLAGDVFAFRARDEEHGTGAGVLENVPVGTHGLRLVLQPARSVLLRVIAQDGKAVERFGWRVFEDTPMGARPVAEQAEGEHPGGSVTLRANVDPLSLEVSARGYETARVGPFALQSLGDTLEARLRRLPVVRGVVTAKADPVAGAEISLLEPLPANQSYIESSFSQQFRRCGSCPKAITDADGRFELFPGKPGAYALRASASGKPVAITDAFDLSSGSADVELHVELPVGGSIEGVVRQAEGRPEQDWIIYASRGDGSPIHARTDARGLYRFDALAPGGWQVHARRPGSPEELSRDSEQTTYTSGVPPPIEWDCHVMAGETCRRDFVLSAPCELALRLEQPFASGTSWKPEATVRCTGDEFEELETHELVLDGSTFRVTLPCSGRASLWMKGTLDGAQWNLSRTLELLAGRNEVPLRISTCNLSGIVPPDQVDNATLSLSWEAPAEKLSIGIRLKPESDGRFSIPHAPAGRSQLTITIGDTTRTKALDLPSGGTFDAGEL